MSDGMSHINLDEVKEKANQVEEATRQSIKQSLENNLQIQHIDDISVELPTHAKTFYRGAVKLSCRERFNNYKFILAIVAIVVLLVLIIVYSSK